MGLTVPVIRMPASPINLQCDAVYTVHDCVVFGGLCQNGNVRLDMVGAKRLTAKSVLPVIKHLAGLGASSACHAVSEKYMQREDNCLHVR